jgi:glycosyltransferase involved in cell wall biosynthesis
MNSSPLRLLIITYYWPPSGGAGVQRWLKLSKYLEELGCSITVVTVDPSKATYPVVDKDLVKEVAPGIEVIRTNSFEPLRIYGRLFGKKRVPYSGFTNVETSGFVSKITRWIRGNWFLPDARKGWNTYAQKAAAELLERDKYDHVITTGPPHSTHIVGALLKEQFNTHWIADFRDPWTDIYYYDQLLLTERNKRRDAEMEKTILESADLVFAVCPSNQKLLRSKLEASKREKVKVLTNGYDPDDFKVLNHKSVSDVFQIGYTGTLAGSYEVEPVLSLLTKTDLNWKLTIAGNVAPEISDFIKNAQWSRRVEFLGHVSHDRALEVLRSSDMLLHVLPNTKHGRMGTTGKLFEYLGSGVPILNIGPKEGDSAIFIEEAGRGRTFNREDEQEILSFMNELHQGKFKLGSAEKFSRKAIAKQLLNLLKNLVPNG